MRTLAFLSQLGLSARRCRSSFRAWAMRPGYAALTADMALGNGCRSNRSSVVVRTEERDRLDAGPLDGVAGLFWHLWVAQEGVELLVAGLARKIRGQPGSRTLPAPSARQVSSMVAVRLPSGADQVPVSVSLSFAPGDSTQAPLGLPPGPPRSSTDRPAPLRLPASGISLPMCR